MKILRTFTRVFVNSVKLKSTIEFYEHLFNVACDLRFKYSEKSLELASVGNVLIIAGADEVLKPFKNTQATFLVDSLSEFREWLPKSGAIILEESRQVPTGFNMRVQHSDGIIVEYVEHIHDQSIK